MKKITFLSVLFVGMLFTSCNNDDDSSKNNNDGQVDATELVNTKWERFKEGFRIQGNETLEDYPHAAGCSKDYIEFLEDGIYKYVVYDGTNDCNEVIRTKFFEASGNTLTVGSEGVYTTSRIEVLSDTEMKTTTIYSNQPGTSPTYKIETYKRLN
ncbi:MAG: hypothetical protein EOO45_17000 [Flavobacterium sp.]|nr:MAG: hypothetical protein EOO45_17000 [Flavobacterium sp.]